MLTDIKRNKIIPLKYENEILTVLNNYPELENVHIHFILVNEAPVPYCTELLVGSCFGRKAKRKYYVKLLNEAGYPEREALFRNLTPRMRMGVIAHELGHVLQYEKWNNLQLWKKLVSYVFGTNRRRIERDADKTTIRHGFGEELLEHAVYIRSIPGYLEERPEISKNYLSPDEIKGYIHFERLKNHPVSSPEFS